METELKELKRGQPYYIQNFEPEVREYDPKTRIMTHKVSKETTDRYRDIVRIAGIETKNYRKNPVMLYGHDYAGRDPLPIMGKNLGFTIEGKRNPTLWAKSQFLNERKVSPKLADLISDWIVLSLAGLGGWSIGFRVLEWEKILDADENWIGYDFKRTELLEYSGVVIPANQEAVNNALNGLVEAGTIDEEKADYLERFFEHKPGDYVPAALADFEKSELWTPSADPEDEYEQEAEIDEAEDEDLNEEKTDPGDGIEKEEIPADPEKPTEVPVIPQSEIEKEGSEALNRIEIADDEESKKAALDKFEADFIKALSDFTDGLLELRKKHQSFFDKFNQE